jgi:anti-sigma factor RsiW
MSKMVNIEERLWDYIDGLCSAEEKDAVQALLQTDPLWQEKYQELLEVHTLAAAIESDAPSMRFTKNVMDKLAGQTIARPARSYVDKRIIRGIGLFFLLIISSLLVYLFANVQWSSETAGNTSFNPQKLSVGKYINNTYLYIFFFIDAVLLLLLTDRWLARRHKQQTI